MISPLWSAAPTPDLVGLPPRPPTCSSSKRPRSRRLPELWPAAKKLRKVCTRSPTKGNKGKPVTKVALVCNETLLPEELPDSVVATAVALEEPNAGTELENVRVVATALGDDSGRSRKPKTGHWEEEENALLRQAVDSLCTNTYPGSRRVPWTLLCKAVPGRTAKQCRERFVEHIDTNLAHCSMSGAEADTIYHLLEKHGRKWSTICREVNAWRRNNCYDGVRSCTMVKNFICAKVSILDDGRRVVAPEAPVLNLPLDELEDEPEDQTVEFFNGFPTIPPHDTELFAELQDFMGVHALDQPYEETCTNDQGWERLLHCSPMDTRTTGVYHEMENALPRACLALRKLSVELNVGDASHSRALFASVNKMINTPRARERIARGTATAVRAV